MSLPATQCFFPNGTLALNFYPCYRDRDTSFCCGIGETCGSNALCYAVDDSVEDMWWGRRGACTDKTWISHDCPKICTDHAPGGTALIWYCKEGTWCCDNEGGGDSCCSTSSSIISLGASVTVVEQLLGIPSSILSTTSAVNNEVTSTSTAASSGTGSGPGPNDSSATDTWATPEPTTTQDTASSSGSSLSKDGTIAIGVSIPLAFVLAILVGVSWWQNRQLKRKILRLSSNYSPPTTLDQQGSLQQLHEDPMALELPIDRRPELSADRRQTGNLNSEMRSRG